MFESRCKGSEFFCTLSSCQAWNMDDDYRLGLLNELEINEISFFLTSMEYRFMQFLI